MGPPLLATINCTHSSRAPVWRIVISPAKLAVAFLVFLQLKRALWVFGPTHQHYPCPTLLLQIVAKIDEPTERPYALGMTRSTSDAND